MDFYGFLYCYLCAIFASSILLRPKPPGIVMASTEIEDDMTTNANLLSLTPTPAVFRSSGAKRTMHSPLFIAMAIWIVVRAAAAVRCV